MNMASQADADPKPGGDERRVTLAFLARMRHDLRTPLNAIIGYSELLIEEARDRRLEALVPTLTIINDKGKYILSLIDDRLAVSRLEEAETLHAGSIGAGLREAMEAPLQVLTEVIGRLAESAKAEPTAFLAEDVARLAAAAARLPVLVAQLVDYPGGPGNVSAPGVPGEPGIPRTPAPGAKEKQPDAARLLVVDDDPANRDLLYRQLTRLDYIVTLAEDGLQALQLLREREFDLVLLDLAMPQMDGFQVLKRMGADHLLDTVPVVVLSASDDMNSVVRSIEMGALDHLSKPFDPVMLRNRLRSALAIKRLKDQEERKRLAGMVPRKDGAEAAATATEAAAGRAAGAEPAEEPTMGIAGFLRCILGWMRPYKKEATIVGILLLLSMLISAALPMGFKFLTDYALLPHNLKALVIILLVLAAAELVSAATDIGRDYFYARLGAKLLNDLRFNMFRHLQRLSMRFYGRVSAGDITARFTTDLAAVDNAVTVCLQGVVCQCLFILFSLVLLFTLEWRLAALSTIGLYLSLWAERTIEPRAEEANTRLKEQQAKIAAVLQENVLAQPVVKMFRLQVQLIERFKHQMIDFFRAAARACFLSYLTYRVSNRCVSFFGLLVIACGAFFVYRGSLTIGELVSFQIILGGLVQSASELTWGLPQLLQAGAGMRRIEQLLGEPIDVTEAPDATSLPAPQRDISLTNVRFGYSADRLNLDDVTMSIPMAGSLLFVGPSGCGKSTVFNLLMRFYDPASGTVCIDGRDIRTVTQDSVRQHIGVVLQESFLFNTTLRENIRMGKGDATDEEVEAAARTAEMHDIIVKMPQGYDTVVGERGGKLSGGQRQRIAIARAIISNPPILLLDEATSALDPATAASINQSLERISKGRTVISVTHRLEAAPGADGIFVFHEGRLAEQGRHDELLKLNGLYARLWNKQAGFSLSEDGTQARVDAARLRAVPILQELDDASLSTIARFFATEHFPPHRPVVQQGDAGDKFYIIVRGKVSVFRTEASGEEHPLAVLEDGDHFGEVALMERIPRTASVHTLTDCVFLTLQREHFLRLVEANPDLKARLEAITAIRSPKQ